MKLDAYAKPMNMYRKTKKSTESLRHVVVKKSAYGNPRIRLEVKTVLS